MIASKAFLVVVCSIWLASAGAVAAQSSSESYAVAGIEITGGGSPVPLTAPGSREIGRAAVTAGRPEPSGASEGPDSGVRFEPGFFVPEPNAALLSATALVTLAGVACGRARRRAS